MKLAVLMVLQKQPLLASVFNEYSTLIDVTSVAVLMYLIGVWTVYYPPLMTP